MSIRSVMCIFTISIFVAPVFGQETLPFPPTPSASKPGLTIQESTHQKRVPQRRLAEDAPNILIILIDDVEVWAPSSADGRPPRLLELRVNATSGWDPDFRKA